MDRSIRDKPIVENVGWARGNRAIIVWIQVGKRAIQTDSRPPCDTTPSDDAHLYANPRIEPRNAHNQLDTVPARLLLCISEYLIVYLFYSFFVFIVSNKIR